MTASHCCPQRRVRRILRSVPLVLPLVAAGCGEPPLSAEGYETATAIYALANREAPEKIDAAAAKIDELVAAGKLSPSEAERLGDMLEDARRGEWAAARTAARKLMQHQVRPAK
ncbi:MAG: hypothetical protein KF688_18915 [Pirellulales bacterium]|nr:hypothetical protein [Pirellulales bacterium]